MDKEKIIKIIAIIFALLALLSVIGAFAAKDYLDNKQKIKEQNNQPTINYASKITVQNIIDKLNTEITAGNQTYLINNDNLTIENGIYYYVVYEDVGFYVIPENFTENLQEETVKTTTIFYKIDSKNQELAQNYVKFLIKANLPSLTDEEIKSLMTKAIESSKLSQVADENNGLYISYDERDNNVFYIITRNYQKE